MELVISNIKKAYSKNNVLALDDVSLDLTPGVYGILGPNGAGKSTLMNIITTNLKQDSGTITYDAKNIFSLGKLYREIIGYMPQQQKLYDEFTAYRFLWYMAALKGLNQKEAKKQINEAVRLVNLESHLFDRLKGFSGGMKQRILIAQALLGDPEILLLDEPTAGLDPRERIRIRNFISDIGEKKIVLLASHVVSDIEYIAKEIIILKNGTVLQQGTPVELLKNVKNKVYEIIIHENEVRCIESYYKVCNLQRGERGILARIVTDEPPIAYDYKTVEPSLEDLYLYLFD